MGAYDFTHIPELTEEEKKSPYARFYYEPILPPAPEILAAIQPGKQMDPSLALSPQDIGRLFVPNSLKVDNGYCVLPDGSGFSIVHSKAADTTLEMERWWSTWFASSEYNYVNYKIWMPSLHFSHAMPIREDMGWGPLKIYMLYRTTAAELNLPASPQELNPDFYDLMCYACKILPDDEGPEKPYYATLAHYITLGRNGLEILTCVWSGIHFVDGKPLRMIGKDERMDLEHVRLFACHNAWEFARKNQLLPRLYAFSKMLKNG